ncbi:hypothetical protein METBIDRAFT_10568 [Metschnikowia bicuspidata var. bicuspidata NRRL YB-4993]|uniref:Uncharacterized protein n=1 Tax=Metschnikowia bicuspidata var. bicuspidata NRRL YB-4993 TaxID=869754 RepID=A0A1A0HKU5_9ASCO|nr:hypothetical protein METBIDRAFT_10568 [Metschnikowia bicuspidata var. bicuspidata NRRL YB-4993]OBA24428.1 hypothetical protein METBIDRAFT_10568 [Metschnikowia bicuspidata var. bicuspidata NRRL YB-4993]
MKLVRLVRHQTSRAVYWVLWPYLLYLVFYGCVSSSYLSNVISRHTCPPLQLVVYPVWFTYVQPHVLWLDKKLHVSNAVSANWHPVKESLHSFDEEHQISYFAERVYTAASSAAGSAYGATSRIVGPYARYVAAQSYLYYRKRIYPSALFYGARYKYMLETSVDFLCGCIRRHALQALFYAKCGAHHVTTLYVAPVCSSIGGTLSQYLFVRQAVVASRAMYSLLLEKLAQISLSLQQKKDFIRSESYNLLRAGDFNRAYFRGRADFSTVVSDILDEITDDAAPGIAAETPETPSESITEDDFSEYSDEDEATLTITQTQTMFVTRQANELEPTADSDSSGLSLNLPETVSEEELTTLDSDSSQAQIEREILYWQSRVDKTLELVWDSLDVEFAPFLASKTEELKDAISANFSSLQQQNFLRYKEMNELIAAIHKDAEFIRETNTTIEEPEIDRQLMRDKIAEAYAMPQEVMKYVEQNLNEAHVLVMKQYNKAAQETVDVLESMAETVILDFSSRLSSLIGVLQLKEDFSDTMTWSAWKSFHKIKESIFEFRDQIFDDASAYKFNARGSKVPRGLESWAAYLGKVNFHISFLMRDNAEYLQLVRAKANVAYQEREGLTYRLKQEAKAKQQQLEKEQLEKEQLEKEQLEKEQLEKEQLEKDQPKKEPLQIHLKQEPERGETQSRYLAEQEQQNILQEDDSGKDVLEMAKDIIREAPHTNGESGDTRKDAFDRGVPFEDTAERGSGDGKDKLEGTARTEASEKDEFVEEATEAREMTGEREAMHDEL